MRCTRPRLPAARLPVTQFLDTFLRPQKRGPKPPPSLCLTCSLDRAEPTSVLELPKEGAWKCEIPSSLRKGRGTRGPPPLLWLPQESPAGVQVGKAGARHGNTQQLVKYNQSAAAWLGATFGQTYKTPLPLPRPFGNQNGAPPVPQVARKDDERSRQPFPFPCFPDLIHANPPFLGGGPDFETSACLGGRRSPRRCQESQGRKRRPQT
ncbi:UNVERIFIED_CONTAM: hypothetical protein K2H54_052957 [Gekko kuhli]